MSKVDLTSAKLADIKRKAEAASANSEGRWGAIDNPHTGGWGLCIHDQGDIIARATGRDKKLKNSVFNHIAAADPATVLAMVEEIELLKKRLSWFPAHIMEKINLAILSHTGGMADPCKENCRCDDSVGYYCEYCAVYDALISCKQATESEAGQ